MVHHLYSGSGVTPLSWRTRIQIAIDVANALVISRMSEIYKKSLLFFLKFQLPMIEFLFMRFLISILISHFLLVGIPSFLL